MNNWNNPNKGNRSNRALLCFAIMLLGLLPGANLQANTITLKTGLATPVMAAETQQTAFLRVSLTGFEQEASVERAPLNVALVLDESSSMLGDKIQRAKEAAILAVSKLSAKDYISIVTYDSTVNVLVPATRASDKNSLYKAIQTIEANGSTALFAGTSKGADQVSRYLSRERVNRVILLSDGMANIGPDTPSELGALGKALAKKGMSVSTIGLGLGYNEDLMTQLANYSDGNHDFVENSADLAMVFDREFGDAMSVVAQDVEIEITCDDGFVPLRVVGREAEIIGNKVRTRMSHLYSAQENYVIVEVQVPAAADGVSRQVAAVQVRYNNMVSKQQETTNGQVDVAFSRSEQQIEKAIDKAAYESAAEQVANVATQRAVELRDQGDVEGAQQSLQDNAGYLKEVSTLLASPRLKQQSEESLEEAAVMAEGADWNASRKLLKEKTYKRSKQQEQDGN